MGFALRAEHLPRYTYDDYALWEGNWELINGVPYAMSPSPTFEHQDKNTSLGELFRVALRQCKQCRAVIACDWIIRKDTVVQPDLSVVCGPQKGKFIEQTPALVAEILSPSTAQKDLYLKREIYASEGVGYYIIIDLAQRSILVLHLVAGQYVELESSPSYSLQLGDCTVAVNLEKLWED